MTHTEPFHPELRTLARQLPTTVVHRPLIPLLRWGTRLMRTGADVEVLTLPSGAGIRLFRPEHGASGPALLWIHGGGLVIGSPTQDQHLCRAFARTLGITVAAVEYRLAPEHPYPAALDDCYDALRWLTTLPAVDPTRVAVGGASAGGGLATALAMWARDRGDVDVAFQLLTYPMLDDRTVPEPADTKRFRLWNHRSNTFAWKAYVGDADPDHAVPGRRSDLSGLPPAWIGVGTNDMFYAEDIAYADRLRAAGVPCEIDVVPGAFHGFDSVAPKSGVSRSFFESRCAALRNALEPNPVTQPPRSQR